MSLSEVHAENRRLREQLAQANQRIAELEDTPKHEERPLLHHKPQPETDKKKLDTGKSHA